VHGYIVPQASYPAVAGDAGWGSHIRSSRSQARPVFALARILSSDFVSHFVLYVLFSLLGAVVAGYVYLLAAWL